MYVKYFDCEKNDTEKTVVISKYHNICHLVYILLFYRFIKLIKK